MGKKRVVYTCSRTTRSRSKQTTKPVGCSRREANYNGFQASSRTQKNISRTSEHVWQFTLEQFIEAVKGGIVACRVFFM